MNRFTICFTAFLCNVPFQAQGEDDLVRAKLEKAKVAYEQSLTKFRELANEHFNKNEEAARVKGSKKLVDQIKAEREAFEKSGELPSTFPPTLRTRPTSAMATLTAAYAQAIKDYTRTKNDDLAAAAAKELELLKSNAGVPSIAGVWQEGTKESRILVTVIQNADKFTATSTYQHKDYGEISWRMTGKISIDGTIEGNLVHTKAPRGWLNQTRTGKFSATDGTIVGRAQFQGGGHEFVWKSLTK